MYTNQWYKTQCLCIHTYMHAHTQTLCNVGHHTSKWNRFESWHSYCMLVDKFEKWLGFLYFDDCRTKPNLYYCFVLIYFHSTLYLTDLFWIRKVTDIADWNGVLCYTWGRGVGGLGGGVGVVVEPKPWRLFFQSSNIYKQNKDIECL